MDKYETSEGNSGHIREIRQACIREYSIFGRVDPRKVASELDLPLEVMLEWLDANYSFESHGDGIGYKQRKWMPEEADPSEINIVEEEKQIFRSMKQRRKHKLWREINGNN